MTNLTNLQQIKDTLHEADIVYRLLKRAEIRRSISSRKSVLLNEPDKIANLLEEAANEIKELREFILKGK